VYPFERFNAASKRVLTLAQEEAERSHNGFIGTEHILLALLREPNTVAGAVLRALNVDIDNARGIIVNATKLEAADRIIIQHIIPTSRVKKVIEISFEEARALGDTFIGTEHILLALLVEGEGIAAHVLQDLGAPLARVRDEVAAVRKAGVMVESSEEAEPTWPSPARGHRATSPRSGLRFVLFERMGTTTADSGPVYVNPADVVAVTQLDEDRSSITLRHNDASTLVVKGAADEVARRLEQA
jgi:ATP-dependent Clp protease ATP-binding subunit ClpA